MRRRNSASILLVVASLAAVLALMEFRWPYYFLQEDNRDLGIPMLVHNLRALRGGEIAQFNFHQFAGIPHLSNGNTALGIASRSGSGICGTARRVWLMDRGVPTEEVLGEIRAETDPAERLRL
jgi:hypothetical protein